MLTCIEHKDLSNADRIRAMATSLKIASGYSKHSAKKENVLIDAGLDLMGAPICNHRGSAPTGDHISLYYPGFHEFVELCETVTIDKKDCVVANDLCLAMAKVYGNEDGRVKEFIKVLKSYFGGISFKNNSKCEMSIGDNQECLLECKNESGISGDAYRQVYAYYIASLETKKFPDKCSAPGFIIEVVGPNLTISGAVFGKYVYIDRLAHHWLVQQPNDNDAMIRIAKTLKALQVCLSDMSKYYSQINSNQLILRQPRFPVYQDVNGSELTYHKEVENYSHLFHASLNGQDVVVKFAQTYCEEAHECLSTHGFAPKLISCDSVGRFKAVVMEEVKDAVCIDTYLAKNPGAKNELLAKCRKALKVLSENNYCHGDFRPCNILVTENLDIFVLDFDWAGECGKVKYPFFMNHAEVLTFGFGM